VAYLRPVRSTQFVALEAALALDLFSVSPTKVRAFFRLVSVSSTTCHALGGAHAANKFSIGNHILVAASSLWRYRWFHKAVLNPAHYANLRSNAL
jgi:hypothetical protein